VAEEKDINSSQNDCASPLVLEQAFLLCELLDFSSGAVGFSWSSGMWRCNAVQFFSVVSRLLRKVGNHLLARQCHIPEGRGLHFLRLLDPS